MRRREVLLWLVIAALAVSNVVSHVQIGLVQAHQNDALSALICHAEHAVKRTSGITEKQREQALRFYSRQIRFEHLKPCS